MAIDSFPSKWSCFGLAARTNPGGVSGSTGLRGRAVPSVEMSMQLSLSFPPNISLFVVASRVCRMHHQFGLSSGRVCFSVVSESESESGLGLGLGDFGLVVGMAHPASICCGPSYWWVRQLKCNNRFELLIGWVSERRATTAAVSQMRNAFKSCTRMMYICTYYRHCRISSVSLNAHPALQPHSNCSFDLWVSLSSGDFPNRLEHVFPARTSLSSKSWGKQVKGSSFEDFFWPLAYSILVQMVLHL